MANARTLIEQSIGRGKPWTYMLILNDAIAENMILEGLARLYAVKADVWATVRE